MGSAPGFKHARMLILLASAALAVGCDRGGDAPGQTSSVQLPPTSTTGPATQASLQMNSGTRPASQPSAEAPAAVRAVLMIDGQQMEFPPARIILTKKGSRMSARLFSDDPKDALDADYAGNSFYFEMPLEADPDQPGAWLWRYKVEQAEASESPNGIYLRGTKTHLQPFDVLVEVDQSPSRRAVVKIIPPSQFRLYDKANAGGLYQLMPVFGELAADVVTR